MNTPEDTFRILKRKPYREMVRQFINDWRGKSYAPEAHDSYFRQHGWTLKEFSDAELKANAQQLERLRNMEKVGRPVTSP